jgi:hypothetical protein
MNVIYLMGEKEALLMYVIFIYFENCFFLLNCGKEERKYCDV